MLLGRLCILILLTLVIQGCCSPKMCQELSRGKVSFINGEYKESFHQLLPIAATGNPDAEYAVGYMYYYGLGTSVDSESGVFWMTRAAEQGNCEAKKALKLIEQKNLKCARTPPFTRCHPTVMAPAAVCEKPYSSSILKERSKPIIKCRPVPIQTHCRDEVLNSIKGIKPTSPHYTLQLYGSYSLNDIKSLRKELELKKTGLSWQTKNKGKDWYVLTYGKYMTVSDAKSALKKLPGELKDMHPWVRPVKEMEIV